VGWSESYYCDMEREAREELRKDFLPLIEAILHFHEALEVYGDFVEDAGELRALLSRLESILRKYG
jgi:hypothetical protein